MALSGARCGGDGASPEAVFEISACTSQSFAILLRDPQTIERASRLVGRQSIVAGAVVAR